MTWVWTVGRKVAVVPFGRGAPEPCVVERVYRDGGCLAAGRRWTKHGRAYGGCGAGLSLVDAALAEEIRKHREEIMQEVEKAAEHTRQRHRLHDRLQAMTTDELRALAAHLGLTDGP